MLHERHFSGNELQSSLTSYRLIVLIPTNSNRPVKGLRKYLSAATQLFDVGKSESELRSLRIEQDQDNTIVATWRMAGVLRLPWRPSLPTMTGTTTYRVDDEGLIYEHVETWDMSVPEAFLKTFYPPLGEHIWDRDCI